ncbi:2-oxoacid:acceptor oxidoreductase subunit alpha [Isachenkonia alkalipeptolytica]|uniref:2-oxoacid:acceptor oxidoreductase subunit alpha n=1 Tax=Isachenkonia alkalipeptolytica TaxID=2565777 RepID=A0AA44BDK1_9CLOT|nr:2-oxoacid:acceptor oxidoreductase subunit alpha [Isachenkonia alkalipeptolytica]NBG87988.1 2-oxoacid:acceptor oxidoreductase subunit alpha [Isachenkonia alkalipeptolytica]
MNREIQVLIGGTQGDGILATGLYYLQVLSRMGYHVYGKRHFTSRIKGGNSAIIAHGSVDKKGCLKDDMDIVMALDEDTMEIYTKKLRKRGLLLYDEALELKVDLDFIKEMEIEIISLPITKVVKDKGNMIMKNVCSLGFLTRVTDIEPEYVESVIVEAFKDKGEEVVRKNKKVLQGAVDYNFTSLKGVNYLIEPVTRKDLGPVAVGNDLIGLGAIMSGCRFMAAYPITPASEVMQYLSEHLPRYGGKVVQTEDELAAVNMIIGSSYAGVRSITGTSGPGVSLMMEGLGLAAMAEVPIVVVDAQRKGPSTGLPTKHEQSDVNTLYYGGHGDFPRIVLAPATFEDCFYDTVEAFNLAEEYQCPVIIMSDALRSLSYENIEALDFDRVTINRGKLGRQEDLDDGEESYKRYEDTGDHISKRVFPGTENGLHHTTGLEHSEYGFPLSPKDDHRGLTEKRMEKMTPLEYKKGIQMYQEKDNNILFLGYGSTFATLEQGVKKLDRIVDYGAIKQIKPLPKVQIKKLLEHYDKVVIVENNYSAQLRRIIQAEIGYHEKLDSLLSYNGDGFLIEEIKDKIKELV